MKTGKLITLLLFVFAAGSFALAKSAIAAESDKQVYPVYGGATIGLGKQGLFIDTAPLSIPYVEIAKVRPPLRPKYTLGVESIVYRGPVLDVTFLNSQMAPLNNAVILASVYFNISEPEVRLWEEGGFDSIGIWYYNKKAETWQPCYTRFVPEKRDNGKYDRLACIVMGSGFYLLGKMDHDPVFPLWFKPYEIDQTAVYEHKQLLVRDE
ncbi:MAG TPA: hypothetical protein EYP88_01920 [Anaerolineales bacterium]|nr:hypothetical protein [Anaerolineales bacterium]